MADVDHHLQLLTCGDELIDMVRAGEVAATTAVALSREHGPQASAVAVEQMGKAKAAGKTKLTRSAALPQFNAAKAREFIQLIADIDWDITIPDSAAKILSEYRDFMKTAGWESGS